MGALERDTSEGSEEQEEGIREGEPVEPKEEYEAKEGLAPKPSKELGTELGKEIAQEVRAQPEEQTHKFVVRLPMPLRNRIAEAAKYFRRSMNSEIIAMLEQSLQGIPSQAESDQLAPQMHDSIQNIFSTDLTADEELVLRSFRRMSIEKQRALLELLG